MNNNELSRFSGTLKANKNLILTITVHHLMYYKVALQPAGVFCFLQMNHPLNKFAHPCFILCVKKHICQQSAFFATNAPSKGAQMRCTIRTFTSEISSRSLATF